MRSSHKASLEEHNASLKFLRGADMGDLIKRPEFLGNYDGSAQSLDATARALLQAGLAHQLVSAGYINRNFTLYSSTFHGTRVGSAAMNFIIHAIERDVMDEYFELEDSDVDEVVRERGKNSLSESALYNIAILDHLLRTDLSAADTMIQSLASRGERQVQFLRAYLGSGKERCIFVRRFTVASPGVLVDLVEMEGLDEETRLNLVDTALQSLASGNRYQTNSSVSTFLSAHFVQLTALTSGQCDADHAQRVAQVFADAGVQVPMLRPLTEEVRLEFIKHSLWTINGENVQIALGSPGCLALDVARSTNEFVYNYLLGHLDKYLLAIEGTSATVRENAAFISVIQDILSKGDARLGDVIEQASEDCIVTNLADISNGAWSVLAGQRRFPPTFSNIRAYLGFVGAIDANVAQLLASAGAISEHESAAEDTKATLALTILAARDTLPSATLRADLVASLQLKKPLDVNRIDEERGELFALLIKQGVVSDSEETFLHLAGTDWPTREHFIRESELFNHYVTPALVKDDLTAILSSDRIPIATKNLLVDEASKYFAASSRDDLSALARFALRRERQVALDVVEQMAKNKIPSQEIVTLMTPHLKAIGREKLFGLLQLLGGRYAKLTSTGLDKPKIPNTSADRALLERLKEFGIVSSYSYDENASLIKVHKKRK